MNVTPENLSTQTTRHLARLAVADEVESRTNGLPQWKPVAEEPWLTSLDRRPVRAQFRRTIH